MTTYAEPTNRIMITLTRQPFRLECAVLHEDGTQEQILVGTTNLRGGQREVTALLKRVGYDAMGRWNTTPNGRTSRRMFTPKTQGA